jgi:hypothetical protein
MINRRFMIVPPALPSGGHAEPLEQTSKDFLCLLLEMANMRVLTFLRRRVVIQGWDDSQSKRSSAQAEGAEGA